MDSTAAAPRPTTSSTSCFCARLNGASTNLLHPTRDAPDEFPGEPGKSWSPRSDHALDPLMPRRRAFRLDPQRLPGKIELVIHHYQQRPGVNSYRSSSPFTAGPLRFINVCGLASATCLSADRSQPDQRHVFFPADPDRMRFRQPVDHHETQVVRRILVLRARDCPDRPSENRSSAIWPRAATSGLLRLLASCRLLLSPAAPSSSFLPFLITSGSAPRLPAPRLPPPPARLPPSSRPRARSPSPAGSSASSIRPSGFRRRERSGRSSVR